MMKPKSTVVLQLLHSVDIKSLDEESKGENDRQSDTTFVCYTVSYLRGSGNSFRLL